VDIDVVMDNQLTTPLEIPFQLEDYIDRVLQEAFEDNGLRNGKRPTDRVLIPVHTSGSTTPGSVPDLPETTGSEGNIRFWEIDQDLLWTGFDHRIDE
jgi:hypothetical protein